MKICIPTESNEGLTAKLYDHFGSTPFFTIYDDSSKKHDIISNGNEHHTHGTCHPLSNLAGLEIHKVVCRGMGARAVQKLNESGIEVYQTCAATVEDAIKELHENHMEMITISNACQHHQCH